MGTVGEATGDIYHNLLIIHLVLVYPIMINARKMKSHFPAQEYIHLTIHEKESHNRYTYGDLFDMTDYLSNDEQNSSISYLYILHKIDR